MKTAVTTPSLPLADWSVEPVGDRCLIVRLGTQVDVATSRTVHAVTAALLAADLPGVVDVVPAFTTLSVYFQPTAFSFRQGLPSAQLTRRIEAVLAAGVPPLTTEGRLVEVPACYGGELGPDLEDVARQCGISPEEVVALHTAVPVTVYAFFFSPGNSFAGPLDARLAGVRRRPTPRVRVEAGSVAIANGITSIYQTTSPGGWNILARTPWNMFDVQADPPTRVQLGDRMQFRPIGLEEFRDTLEARP